MVELSNEKIENLLHEETVKKQESDTILRCVYIRYMKLYENYFADIDALNDDKVAELRSYHEETRSLVKYYYMDIPQDICKGIREFDNLFSIDLLGPQWHKYLFDSYEDFKNNSKNKDKSEDFYKAEFTKEILESFYDAMDYIFREGFGTGSRTVKSVLGGFADLLFGKDKKDA